MEFHTAASFPAYLRGRLEESGLTARRFAHELGVSESLLSRLLSGRVKPSPKVIDALGGGAVQLFAFGRDA